MPLEYKVVEDSSFTGANKPDALTAKVNEMVKQGWRFAHVTSFATNNVSKVYLFFERDEPTI